MAVITLSREFGSGGDEIAQLICRDTGYQTFNKDLIARAAVESGFSDQGPLVFSEIEPRVSGFLDRLFGRQAPAAEMHITRADSNGLHTVETTALNEDQVLDLVQQAVGAAYRHGNFLIVGRGGQVILRHLPGVLHVRVIASMEERILRVRSRQEFAGASSSVDVRRAAQNLIESQDAASQDYLRRCYGIDWADPNLYDIIINTTRMSLETAALMVVAAARKIDAVLQPA